MHDEDGGVYKFFVGTGNDLVTAHNPDDVAQNTYWVLDYEPLINEVGGNFQPPRLCFDVRSREDRCGAVLANPGAKRGDLYVGSCDGKIRKENVASDADDDGDAYLKRLHIQTPHYFWGSPGGAPNEGWVYPTFWMYCVHDVAATTTSTLNLFVGDEGAWEQVVARDGIPRGSYYELVPGGYLEDLDMGSGVLTVYETRRVWYTTPNVAGRGMTVTWSVASPDSSVVWYGFGGTRRPGENFRGATLMEQQGG